MIPGSRPVYHAVQGFRRDEVWIPGQARNDNRSIPPLQGEDDVGDPQSRWATPEATLSQARLSRSGRLFSTLR